MKIKKGEELLLVKKGDRLLIEKSSRVQKVCGEFMLKYAESVAQKLWNNNNNFFIIYKLDHYDMTSLLSRMMKTCFG